MKQRPQKIQRIGDNHKTKYGAVNLRKHGTGHMTF